MAERSPHEEARSVVALLLLEMFNHGVQVHGTVDLTIVDIANGEEPLVGCLECRRLAELLERAWVVEILAAHSELG